MVTELYTTEESRRKADEEHREAMRKIDLESANETKRLNKIKMKFIKFLSSKFPELKHGYPFVCIFYNFYKRRFSFNKVQFHLSNGFPSDNGIHITVFNKDYLKDIERLCKEYESKNNISLVIFFDT